MTENASPRRPQAPEDDLAAQYFAWHGRGELRIQRCARCDRWSHPPLLHCPECSSSDMRWTPTTGRGHVFTWTVTHHAFSPAFADTRPYVSAVIRTEEGPRVLSLLHGVEPERVRAGMPVEVGFQAGPDGVVRAIFRVTDRHQ